MIDEMPGVKTLDALACFTKRNEPHANFLRPQRADGESLQRSPGHPLERQERIVIRDFNALGCSKRYAVGLGRGDQLDDCFIPSKDRIQKSALALEAKASVRVPAVVEKLDRDDCPVCQ